MYGTIVEVVVTYEVADGGEWEDVKEGLLRTNPVTIDVVTLPSAWSEKAKAA